MADSFPPSEPELSELSTCGHEAEPEEEDMEDGGDFAVELGATYSCRKADGTYLDAEVLKKRTNKRAKREEYMVRYVGMARRQTEWVDKSRLVLLKPQEDEDAEEGSDQEMSENGQTLQNQKPDEDEPETKKVKVDNDEPAAKSLVMKAGDFSKELTCLLCGKLYEDPVMVECGHDFCRGCVEKVWADDEFFTCPDCKQVLTEKSYARNRALNNMVKKASAVAPIIPFKNCDEHQEQVKLYCKDDGTLCCIICHDSLKHANHSILPIEEAVGLYRTELSGLINPLEEALTKTEDLTVQYSEGIEQHQSKMGAYRQKVASEFETLYCFLKERKEALLQQLQKQGKSVLKKMETNADKMAKNRVNLKEAVVAANERVDDADCYSFLADIKPFFKKIKAQKKAALSCRDALANQELCHAEFHGPVQYIFWRQLKSLIGPIPEYDEQVSPLRSEAPEPKVGPPELKDADKETDKQQKPEESDEEEAAQVPEIPAEDFSDLANRECKEIWIVGDGYVNAVGRQAAKGPYANNLLFPKSVCNVRWLGNVKAWAGLMSKLKREVETQKKPNILFLHIGSHELGHRGFEALNASFLNDLDGFLHLFPRVEVILSTVLPRKEWMTSPVERNRKNFNSTLRRYAGKHRFLMVKHEDLETALIDRLEGGGDSLLNDSECEMFLKNMREALIKELRGRMRSSEKAVEEEIPVGQSGSSLTAGRNTELSFRKFEPRSSPADRERELMKKLLAFSKEPQTIWIVGNIYIYKAYGHVGKRPYGPNLGLKEYNWSLRWLGRSTRWNRMLPELQKSVGAQGMPNAIFLHLGSEDLELGISYEGMINDMRNSLGQLTVMFPKVKLILSAVLPRAEWLGTHVEEWRKMFNTRLNRYAERYGFQMVPYTNLEQRLSLRFRRDRNSNLNLEENDLLVSGIRDSLLKTMLKDLNPVSEKPDSQERKSTFSREARTDKEVHEGASRKPIQPSAERRERTQSSTKRLSDSDVSITERESRERSIDVEEESQGSAVSSDKKLILMIGNYLISKARGYAFKAAYGTNLGFDEDKWKVRWVSTIATWSKLVPAMKKYEESDVGAIFLYLGNHDLGSTCFSTFFCEVRYSSKRLARLFPKAQIILSTLLPKAEWMTTNLEYRRKKYNTELPTHTTKQGFEYVKHDELEEKLLDRINEGDHSDKMTDDLLQVFVKTVKDALVKATEKGDRIPIEPSPQEDNLDEDPEMSELDNAESDQPEFEEPPIDPDNLPEHKIWIVGNTLIREVHMHALNSSLGQNLGLERRNWTLHWVAKVVHWSDLFLKLRDTSHILGVPSAVFVHLGNNDLGQCRITKLIGKVRSLLGQLSLHFPKTQFVVSPLLTRAEWINKPLGACRRRFNSSMADYAIKCGYGVASHNKLEKIRLARFKSGDRSVDLSPEEREEFMKSIRISLLKAMLTDHRAASGVSFVPSLRREPQEIVLSSGATFYFVPDIVERRPLIDEDEDDKKPRWALKRTGRRRSSERSESDQSDSDRSSSDEDDSDRDKSDQEDRDKSDQEDGDKADPEKAEKEKEKGTEEKSSAIREEAEKDKERTGTDEGRAAVQEKAEQDVEMKDAGEKKAAIQDRTEQDVEMIDTEKSATNRKGAEQNQEKMECDPQEPLPKNEGAPVQPEHPPVDSSTAAPVEEKPGPQQVWVIGCSFLCRAKQHAYSKPYWNNLGFDEENLTVHWMGCIGMRWEALEEEVDKARRDLGIPSIIVVHLGGNDMGRMPYKEFFKALKYDFRRFARRLRKTQIIFSTILPRAEWLMTPVEQVRMKFNQSVVKCAWSLGFHVLVHDNIEEKVKARFKSGRGNDLSDMEYHLYLTSIRDSVQKVLTG